MSASQQLKLLSDVGWNSCPSIAEGLERVGLPVPTPAYLRAALPKDDWERAEDAVDALRQRFKDARFAGEVTFGILLVPDPGRLDTRGALDPEFRHDVAEITAPDFQDGRLSAGEVTVPSGKPWTMVATVTGQAGIHLGSYHDVEGLTDLCTVRGVDTRKAMTRQVWGARVLQCGRDLPDSTARGGWTFTLFPGEGLHNGAVASGTVLHGRVRFRLGKPDRGIAVVRVGPALVVD